MSKKNIQYRVIPHDASDPAILKMTQELGSLAISIQDPIAGAMDRVLGSEQASVLVLDENRLPSFIITQNSRFASSTLALKDRDLPPNEMTKCCAECLESGHNGCFVTEGLACICIDTITKDGGPIEVALAGFIKNFDVDPR
ncbi:MAG: hypothetical protein R3C18_12130 [Planctomycetaceae bacterium]